MSNRLKKIVTRGGDKGETSLADGTRLAKDDMRIALIGDVDELNSWIGVVVAHLGEGALAEFLSGAKLSPPPSSFGGLNPSTSQCLGFFCLTPKKF